MPSFRVRQRVPALGPRLPQPKHEIRTEWTLIAVSTSLQHGPPQLAGYSGPISESAPKIGFASWRSAFLNTGRTNVILDLWDGSLRWIHFCAPYYTSEPSVSNSMHIMHYSTGKERTVIVTEPRPVQDATIPVRAETA